MRSSTDLVSGQLVKTEEEFDPQAKDWKQHENVELADKPQLKVSQNGRLALEAGTQARLFFVDAGEADTINERLDAKHAGVRIQLTGLAITFPNGVPGRAGSFTLTQASAIDPADVGPAVDKLADLHTETLGLETECHNIAMTVAHEGDPTALPPAPHTGMDAAAQPDIGQMYHFKARSAADVAAGPDPVQTTVPLEPKPLGFWDKLQGKKPPAAAPVNFLSVMNELKGIDDRLARVGETLTMAEALSNLPPTLSPQAKAHLPGWGSHSEAVVAMDGGDSITMVNYNRDTESMWVFARVFREMYRNHQKLRDFFRTLVATHLGGKADVAADETVYLLSRMRNEVLPMITKLAPEQGQMLADLRQAQGDVGRKLWYFDMYGAGAQSFHAQYQAAATRGLSSGQTTVVGTEAPVPVGTG